MKLNFEQLEIFIDIAHKQCQVSDMREAFANVLYQSGQGIAAHSIAMKIYQSKGETEYDEREVELIKKYSELTTPAFIDAVNRAMEESNNQ